MGVQGLTSFVDHNQHLLTDLKLHDTRVVVDGNNLYHFQYYYFKVQHQYGGDYDIFADKVRYYFNTLRKCNIEPYVVFDGAYEEDDKKLRTTLKRAKDRIHNAHHIASGKKATVSPILAFETFVNVLDELKVPHVTCDFEADREAAALAKEWKCPVMSNDSDFFIFDNPGGFILFDYLCLVVKEHKASAEEENYYYLDAQIYYLKDLLSFVTGMDRECIALFATLMGNDYVESEEFDTFFAQGHFHQAKHTRLLGSKRQERMISLLMWLESAQTLEVAMSNVLKYVKKENRTKIRNLLEMSVGSYLNLDSYLVEYFSNDKMREAPANILVTKQKKAFPAWLVKEARASNVPVTALNAMVLQRVILLAQIEVMAWDSAYDCAQQLRQIFYGVLLSFNDEDSSSVTEYTRQSKNLKKQSVPALFSLNDGSKVPHLLDIPMMAENARYEFFLKCFGNHDFGALNIDDCYALAVHVIPFWIMHSDPRINVLYLYALLVTFIKVSILDKRHGLAVGNKDGSVTLKEKCSSKNRGKAREIIEKMYQKDTGSHCDFDAERMHAYSQYQACLKAAMYLNNVLLNPFPATKPEKILNGTCFYHLCKELRLRRSPKAYVEELLGHDSHLCEFFHSTLSAILDSIPEGVLIYPDPGKKKSKKRKIKAATEPKVSSGSDRESEGGDTEEKITAACALGNKFAMLQVE